MKTFNYVASMAMSASLLAACATTPTEPISQSDIANVATVFLAEKARSNLANRYWQREETKWAVDCVSEWDAEDMGRRLAPLVRLNLTVEELEQARDFLATPTGTAYAERALYRAPREPLTEGQSASLKAFSTSVAARKLLDPRSLAQFTDALAAASADKLAECKTKHESRPAPKADAAILPVNLANLKCTTPQVVYPAEARRNGLGGKATVRFWTNTRGLVYLTLVVESSNVFSLDDAAEKGVRGMQCKPYLDGGKAVRVTARQPVQFELN